MDLGVIKFPFGAGESQAFAAGAATHAIDITQSFTVLDFETTAMTGNKTINLTIDENVPAGATLLLKGKASGGARTITFGTGITDQVLTITQDKTVSAMYVYDGTNFLPAGTVRQNIA